MVQTYRNVDINNKWAFVHHLEHVYIVKVDGGVVHVPHSFSSLTKFYPTYNAQRTITLFVACYFVRSRRSIFKAKF